MEDGFCNGGIYREGASRPKEADAKRQTGIKIKERTGIFRQTRQPRQP